MGDAKRKLVRAWLVKAEHDLGSARKLSADPGPLLDTAIFHCQQAAEKAIKGFLVYHDKRFDRTHDIEVLLGLAATVEPGFSSWVEAGDRLTNYALDFRYPGDVLEPERAEFDEALRNASDLVAFVLNALPKPLRP